MSRFARKCENCEFCEKSQKMVNGAKKKTNPQLGLAIFAKIVKNRKIATLVISHMDRACS